MSWLCHRSLLCLFRVPVVGARLWLTSGLLFWWLLFHSFVQSHQANVVLWPNSDWVWIPVRPPPAGEKGSMQFLFESAGGADLHLRLGCRALHGEESSDPLGFDAYSLQSWHLRHSDEKPRLLEVSRGRKISRWHVYDIRLKCTCDVCSFSLWAICSHRELKI